MKRILLIIIGVISTVCGTVGIFVPVLPTTPFLLLALWCFARSSKKCEYFIRNNRLFGKYIDDYSNGAGIPMRAKKISVAMLWITILASNFLFINNHFVKAFLSIVAIFVTVHIIGNPTKEIIPNESSSPESKASIS